VCDTSVGRPGGLLEAAGWRLLEDSLAQQEVNQ